MHSGYRYKDHQENTNPDIPKSSASPPILKQHSKTCDHRKPTMAARIAILNRTIKPNVPDFISRPDRPRITMISLN